MFSYSEIENKWKKAWDANNIYRVDIDTAKPKYYVLDMFPYPSGAGLHVGHPLGYIASDIFARYKRMKGYNVLHPMGFDAFGLPAEQYAIQTGVHPAVSTNKNIDRYRDQLGNIGFSYDWSREVKTCDPQYYKWTQWIFIRLFEHYYDTDLKKARHIDDLISYFETFGSKGTNAYYENHDPFTSEQWRGMSEPEKSEVLMHYRLAYRKTTYVNWCEALGTVLANDEVKDGFSERGGFPVEKKPMLQWSLRITAYAERLLDDLQELEWSDSIKAMQENWIGRSEGARIFFDVEGHKDKIEVFTTRPDTIFGATFMVLAPEHDLVQEISTEKDGIDAYLKYVNTRSDRERMSDVKSVTGAFTGGHAIHPFTGKKIPIWIAEYVLKDYGTGAIMAVPSDDERDQRFAEKFGLDVIPVVDKSGYENEDIHAKVGTMINSGFLDGMEVKDAISSVIQEIENQGIGSRQVNYKLRDANYSRQRYWGEPFPIAYDDQEVPYALKDEELPLELPELDDFKPASDGQSPLARTKDWVNLPEGHHRETDTMPGFAGSSWYFLRYMDPANDSAFASEMALEYWRDVDLYVGGTEHAVGHLMYARFWHKFLHDKGLVPTNEPFKKLINQGMIQGIIESLYLRKEKTNGYAHFICAGIVERDGLEEEVVKVPILIDFVYEYGTPGSFINVDAIKKFIDWRPEYNEALFECAKGIFHKGAFTPHSDAPDAHLLTVSEVGKMSKSKYNVINPDLVVAQYGADVFRMYEMFLGPIEASKPWDTNGIDGVSKFLRKYVSLFHDDQDQFTVSNEAPSREELKILHKTIKRIQDDIERFSFNTCISSFMIAVNELKKINCNNRDILESFNRLMAPFAPFTCEEVNSLLGQDTSVHQLEFPILNESFLVEDEILYPISINGKKRGEATFPSSALKEDIEAMAREHEVVIRWAEGKDIKRIIVVPGRMINIVV